MSTILTLAYIVAGVAMMPKIWRVLRRIMDSPYWDSTDDWLCATVAVMFSIVWPVSLVITAVHWLMTPESKVDR